MENKSNTSVIQAPELQPDEHLGREEGLRIARQALMREVAHYGGQGAIAMAIIGAIVWAGFWSLKELRYLPSFVAGVTRPFLPPVQTPADKTPPQPNRAVAEKSVVRQVRKHAPRPRSMQIAAKAPKRSYYAYQDDPKGGHIIYQDGMITQYTWDK